MALPLTARGRHALCPVTDRPPGVANAVPASGRWGPCRMSVRWCGCCWLVGCCWAVGLMPHSAKVSRATANPLPARGTGVERDVEDRLDDLGRLDADVQRSAKVSAQLALSAADRRHTRRDRRCRPVPAQRPSRLRDRKPLLCRRRTQLTPRMYRLGARMRVLLRNVPRLPSRVGPHVNEAEGNGEDEAGTRALCVAGGHQRGQACLPAHLYPVTAAVQLRRAVPARDPRADRTARRRHRLPARQAGAHPAAALDLVLSRWSADHVSLIGILIGQRRCTAEQAFAMLRTNLPPPQHQNSGRRRPPISSRPTAVLAPTRRSLPELIPS